MKKQIIKYTDDKGEAKEVSPIFYEVKGELVQIIPELVASILLGIKYKTLNKTRNRGKIIQRTVDVYGDAWYYLDDCV
jgi:hypothetical protein